MPMRNPKEAGAKFATQTKVNLRKAVQGDKAADQAEVQYPYVTCKVLKVRMQRKSGCPYLGKGCLIW